MNKSEKTPGETDLKKLLAGMSPELLTEDYVFCSLPEANYGDHAELKPMAAILEAEGLTLVLPKAAAETQGFNYASVYKAISLRVHSSLDAVGLTAAFAEKLSTHGISANVIAGYYHDHIFVPQAQAQKAIEALNELTR